MISNYIIIIFIVFGAICLLCICTFCEFYNEDRQTMRNRQIQRDTQLPPTYVECLTNPPSYSEACKQIAM